MFDPNLSIEDSKLIVNFWINEFRDNYAGDYFTWNNSQWNSDPTAKTNVTGATSLLLLNGGVLPAGFTWRDYNNNNVPMTGPQMAGLAVAMLKWITACYMASWQHKANIDALTDLQSIQEYDYTNSLWPNKDIQLS